MYIIRNELVKQMSKAHFTYMDKFAVYAAQQVLKYM